MAGFVSRLQEINAVADAAPGFIWRHQSELGYEQGGVFDDDIVVNLSVWKDLASLRNYVYGSLHREMLARRQDWFLPVAPSFAAWHVEEGHRPSLAEAKQMLDRVPAPGVLGIEALRDAAPGVSGS